MNYLSKYLIEEATAISSSAKNLDDKEVNKALNLLDNCYKNKLKVTLEKDNNFDISEYVIEFKSKNNKPLEKIENISLLKNNLIDEQPDNKKILKFKKKNFYKKKFYRKKAK